MRIELVIGIVFLIVSQFFCEIVGAKTGKKKSKEPKEILKEITTGLEQCAKSNNKNKEMKQLPLKKCLSDIKTQKNFLDKNDKTDKDILKKVFTKLIKCLKSVETSKNTNKKSSKKNRRRKRQLQHFATELLEQILNEMTSYDLVCK